MLKFHNDISGDYVTLNFDDLLRVANIAAGNTFQEVQRRINEIQDGFFPNGKISDSKFASEKLLRDAEQLHKSLEVLHSLKVLQETSPLRESLRIFNSPCKIESVE